MGELRGFFCGHLREHHYVIKRKHFPPYWPFVRGIHRSPVNPPHKGQWRGALMFSLICARISDWVNNREAGDFNTPLGSLWFHSKELTALWRHLRLCHVRISDDRRDLTISRGTSKFRKDTLQWHPNGRDGASNHQRLDCLLNRLFRRRSKGTPKLRVTGLCVGNAPVTSVIPAQRASNAENVSIWWHHHDSRWISQVQAELNWCWGYRR